MDGLIPSWRMDAYGVAVLINKFDLDRQLTVALVPRDLQEDRDTAIGCKAVGPNRSHVPAGTNQMNLALRVGLSVVG
jgi:hypothetical protein